LAQANSGSSVPPLARLKFYSPRVSLNQSLGAAPMFHQFGTNDAIMFVSLGYTCMDLLTEWEHFSTCSRPMHKWLFTSCVCAMGFRLMRLLGSWASLPAGDVSQASSGNRAIGGQIGEYLFDMGHKGRLANAIATFTWSVFVPFFALWNFLGTWWLWKVLSETPKCIPTFTHVWFSVFWLFLTYMWLFVHIALQVKAWRLRCRVHRAEANLREVEDAETLGRWGQMSRTAGTRSLVEAAQRGGLCPAAIKALPCEVVLAGGMLDACHHDCSICLTEVSAGENVRRLPRCGHVFHRSCIDLWLVRQADCPLCKQDVMEGKP